MIDLWFPTCVYYSDDNGTHLLQFYKSLLDEIFLEVSADKHPFGESKLSTSFWHERHGHLYKDERFIPILEIIEFQARIFLFELGYGQLDKGDIKFLNFWANYIDKNDYHALHVHNSSGSSLISGIFYLDAPKEAQLQIASPYRDTYIPLKPRVEKGLNSLVAKYDCKPGRIIMFPSNVYHGYDSHGSDKIKISMPFNLTIDHAG